MQAVIETIFDAVYLVSVITIGILMIRGSKGNKQFRLFGLMAVVLGAGDSFHLIPRALALCTTGLENYTVPLGLGKWITSVTMTVFYVLLYYVWRQRYQIKGKSGLTASIYLLSAVRVVLCMMDVADHRAQLRLLHPGRALGGHHPDDRHADDPQDLRLRVDGSDRLLRDEEGVQIIRRHTSATSHIHVHTRRKRK